MTPSKQAKAQGLKSLAQVGEISKVKVRTLDNWFNYKPELFEIVLLGCKVKLSGVAGNSFEIHSFKKVDDKLSCSIDDACKINLKQEREDERPR